MATTLNTVARSNLRASKGKYILTGIGIAIPSFFIAAIMMLTNSLQATVNSSVGVVLSRAEAVVASVTRTGCAVTAEEHSVLGGLGSAVAETLGARLPAPLERVGTKDVFGVSGTMDELFDYFGLRAADIARAARPALERRS